MPCAHLSKGSPGCIHSHTQLTRAGDKAKICNIVRLWHVQGLHRNREYVENRRTALYDHNLAWQRVVQHRWILTEKADLPCIW